MKQTIKRLYKTIRHGTAIESFRYRLLKLTGINIAPYYLMLEGTNFTPSLEFQNQLNDYTYEFLGPDDMKAVQEITSWKSTEAEWLELLGKGKKCYAVKYQGQIVASMWIDFDEIDSEWGKKSLKPNEAYLFSMCTKESFRGRAIASYLRYASYNVLKDMNRDILYSYSSYFNVSSIKFKLRLNAVFLKLGLYIELFNKFRWNLTLKNYR